MPSAARGHPVHHVRGRQLHSVRGQGFGDQCRQHRVIIVALRAVCTVLVDDDRDRRTGSAGRGHLGEVIDAIGQRERKINAHNASQLATVDGDQDQGLFGHEAQNGGQRGYQRRRPVDAEPGGMW